MSTPSSSAVRALALEYKSLQEEPVEGFRVKLLNDDNLFEWEVAIFGPPDTLYQGGYFKVSFCCCCCFISSLCFPVENLSLVCACLLASVSGSLAGWLAADTCVCLLHGYSSGSPFILCSMMLLSAHAVAHLKYTYAHTHTISLNVCDGLVDPKKIE